jgi:hypothetical protein
MRNYQFYGLIALLLVFLAACQAQAEETSFIVVVQVGNTERTFIVSEPMTVEDFLNQDNVKDIGITWDENDRLVPPLYTQITDGTRITIVSVDEEEVCETEVIPYEVVTLRNEAFEPDEQRVQQNGENGEQQVCYRIIYENGQQTQRIPIGQPEVIREPINEILVVGVSEAVEPVPIVGTLSYINNGNAWIITRNSTEKRALTITSDLDSFVFDLSANGQYLLYTRKAEDSESFVNELWVMNTTLADSSVKFSISDVLYAEWLPEAENTISYSTGEVRDLAPGWDALNNLWVSRIDPETGNAFNPRQIVEESSGGLYGWWGTVFKWSSDGEQLAWSQAEAVGIYNNGEQIPLTQFASFRNLQDWSWRSSLSWSWDNQLITTVVHGLPVGNAPADTSPVFNVLVTDIAGTFEALIQEGAGMWASPKFSPQLQIPDAQYPQGYLAYLRARDPNNSVFGEYDLIVADRDGSNARIVFPQERQIGIKSSDFGLTPQDFTWSPDGRQIAIIYQGDLYIVDVESKISYRLTFDGGSQNPVWTR